MLADTPDAFPPEPFSTFQWLEFMRQIGLQHNVSVNQLLEFAELIAADAAVAPSDTTFDKARTFVTHLFKRPNVTEDESVLSRISDVAFVPAARVNTTMEKIFPAYTAAADDGRQPYVRFRDAVPENHETLVWSSAYLLPDWANPYKLNETDVSFTADAATYDNNSTLTRFDGYVREVARQLGVSEEPTVVQVMEHTRNVCGTGLYAQLTDMDDLKAYMKLDVMKMVYRFLQQHMADMEPVACAALDDTCCIVVDLGYTFVRPRQVVIDLYEEDQIVPYLYKLPTELGEFKKLFTSLGATPTPTFDQYAMVLESISQQTHGDKLHPNEMRAAFKAVFELFTVLKRHPNNPISRKTIFLPSVSGRLYPSTDLVFNNDPVLTDRIRFFDCPFLVELSECMLGSGANHEELVQLLPASLQPPMITNLVSEHLEERCRQTVTSFSISEKLRHQLNSRAFCMGLHRIIRHEQRRSGQKVDDITLEGIRQALRQVCRVYTSSSLQCGSIINKSH